MPIYEFACPKCRLVFSFLSKRVQPGQSPACPKCGHKKLTKEISRFAALKGSADSNSPDTDGTGDDPHPDMPDMDHPRLRQAMGDLERDMASMDENNPRHMAHLMRKMKEIMPAGPHSKDLDTAIKRLEAGEDPASIEADMGDVLGDLEEQGDDGPGFGGQGGGTGAYARDPGLYDY